MKRQKHWFRIDYIASEHCMPGIVKTDTVYVFACDISAARKKFRIRKCETLGYCKITNRSLMNMLATYES